MDAALTCASVRVRGQLTHESRAADVMKAVPDLRIESFDECARAGAVQDK
jgi:hypothetical protein